MLIISHAPCDFLRRSMECSQNNRLDFNSEGITGNSEQSCYSKCPTVESNSNFERLGTHFITPFGASVPVLLVTAGKVKAQIQGLLSVGTHEMSCFGEWDLNVF